MAGVISKLFIQRFYKVNAGLFLVSFIALFGIMSGVDTLNFHHALMRAITGSATNMLLAFVVFGLYNLKCISFSLKEIQKPENVFLFQVQGVSDMRQLLLYTYCHASLYLPVFMYGVIAAIIGFKDGHVVLAVFMLLWQGAMCLAGAYITFHQLNTTWKYPAIRLPEINFIKKRGYYFYLLYHSLYNRKGAIVGIKILSLVLLQFMVALNADKPSKENVCFLVLLCISTHALLPVYFADFQEKQLGFMRNMPLALWQRYALYFVTYALLFLPELLFLLWNERNVLPLSVIFSLYALAIGRLMLYSSLQYLKNLTLDRYTGLIFVMFFVTLVLLAAINLWVFSGIELALSAILFGRLYYRYESTAQVTA